MYIYIYKYLWLYYCCIAGWGGAALRPLCTLAHFTHQIVRAISCYIIVVLISISILCIDLYVAYLAISMIFYLHNRVSPIQCNGTPPFHRAAQWRISRFVRLEKFWVGCFLYIGSTVRVCGHPKWSKWRFFFWHFFARLVDIGQKLSSRVDTKGGGPVAQLGTLIDRASWAVVSYPWHWNAPVGVRMCVYLLHCVTTYLYMYIHFLNKYQSVLASWSKPLPDSNPKNSRERFFPFHGNVGVNAIKLFQFA